MFLCGVPWAFLYSYDFLEATFASWLVLVALSEPEPKSMSRIRQPRTFRRCLARVQTGFYPTNMPFHQPQLVRKWANCKKQLSKKPPLGNICRRKKRNMKKQTHVEVCAGVLNYMSPPPPKETTKRGNLKTWKGDP